jgi:tetratricopeptide (TPR) repeat protein
MCETAHIDPSYRDAHCNLGVLYARVGRTTDARAEFQKALDIGPPAAPIYANLALASAAAGEFTQAQTFAQRPLNWIRRTAPPGRFSHAIRAKIRTKIPVVSGGSELLK